LKKGILFSPASIGRLEIINRLVRSATAERGADEKGIVTDEMVEMYNTAAQGGAGLIISGHSYIHPLGRTNAAMTGIHCDETIPGLRKVVKAVRRNSEAKVFLQISHAGRVTTEAVCGGIPAGPSAIPVRMSGEKARELSSDEIEELVHLYTQAVLRAQEADFNGVQLHCAHGYLISQFLSGYTNKREDKWGQDKRLFLMRVIDEVKQAAPDFPLIVKINSQDFVPGGVTLEEFAETCLLLERRGILAVEVSGGIPEAGNKSTRKEINKPEKEGYFLEGSRALKSAGLKIPIIAVGGFRSLPVCEEALQHGDADLIAMCRPLITQPDLPRKWQRGENEVSRCISCNKCLTNSQGLTHCVHWTEQE